MRKTNLAQAAVRPSGARALIAALLAVLLVAFTLIPDTADAATVNVVSDTSTIVDASLQIKLDYDDMTITWADGVNGAVINGESSSNGTSSHYLLVVEREDTDGWSIDEVCTITFTDATTIGGRSVDVTITFSSLVYGSRWSTSKSGETEDWVEFAFLDTDSCRLYIGTIHDGYVWRGANSVEVTTTVTWHDTGTVVALPFFTVISDIDAGGDGTYVEAWEAIEGFDEFWVYEGNLLSISGTKFSSTYTVSMSSTTSYTLGGVYASTTGGSFRSAFYFGHCSSVYTLFSSYFDTTMDPPEKTADVDAAQADDTVTWTIVQDFGEFLVDTVTCYSSWTLTDALPDGLAYVSASVVDSSGTDLTASAGTLSYDSATNTVAFSFNESWLSDEGNYEGQTITMTVVTTIEEDAAGTIENEAVLNVGGVTWSDSDMVEVLAPSLVITKSVEKSSYSFGESMVWTVTVTNTGTGEARNVVIADTLPSGLALDGAPVVATSGTVLGVSTVSGSSGDDSWRITATSMAVGASVTVTFTTTAPVVSLTTSYLNTAAAKADHLSTVKATAQAEVAPATGALKIAKTVEGGTSVTASQSFSFVVEATDASGSAVSGDFAVVYTDAAGAQTTSTVSFSNGSATIALKDGESATIKDLIYGTSFTVSEASYAGYTTTSSGATGTIGAGTTATAAFVNSYSASGSWSPEATKTLDEGVDDLTYYTFEFALADSDGTVLLTGTSDAEGNVSFGDIDYTTADLGTHVYTLYEVDGGDEDIDYDDAIVQVAVTVEDNGDGTLSISATYDGVATLPAFANFYAEHEVVLPSTGQSGIGVGLVAGAVLVACGLVGVAMAALRSRRRYRRR